MAGMNVMDHIEESKWYKGQREEGKIFKGQLFKGSGHICKSSVPGMEGSLMSKQKKTNQQKPT